MILRRALPCFVLVVLGTGVAAAASPREKAEARQLITGAKKAMKETRFADAEQALRRAAELDPTPQTQLDLAAALAAEGKLVEASRALHGVTDAAASPATKKSHDQAKKALADLEPRIPWIQVDVGGPSAGEAHTTIDGKDVDASSEVPFDPGEHRVAVAAEGFEAAERSVSLKEGAHEHLHLDLAPIAKAPPPKVSGGSSAPAIAFLSLGGAGLIVGGAAGIAALMQASDAKSQCTGNVCKPSAADAIDRSKLSGTISTVGFIAGGVGVATGIILLIASPGAAKKAPEKESARVTPWIGAGQAGLSGSF